MLCDWDHCRDIVVLEGHAKLALQFTSCRSILIGNRDEIVGPKAPKTAPHLIQADATCNRTIVSFGYVRGTFLKAGQRVHVPGLGDYSMAEVTAVEDPCPFPSGEKKRRLNQKEKVSKQKQRKSAAHKAAGAHLSQYPEVLTPLSPSLSLALSRLPSTHSSFTRRWPISAS